jgi:hypothetical protein
MRDDDAGCGTVNGALWYVHANGERGLTCRTGIAHYERADVDATGDRSKKQERDQQQDSPEDEPSTGDRPREFPPRPTDHPVTSSNRDSPAQSGPGTVVLELRSCRSAGEA